MKQPVFGVIADDFTGATDIASMLRRGGMTVLQTIGAPTETFEPGQAEAIVVSLKSRSLPATEAVSESLAALSALRALGISRLQFKYCSTFDSTPDGNIGPVSDALATARIAGMQRAWPAVSRGGAPPHGPREMASSSGSALIHLN